MHISLKSIIFVSVLIIKNGGRPQKGVTIIGQYYNPSNIDKKESIYSHDYKFRWTNANGKVMLFGNGLKLMEHSWLNNRFVGAVEMLIAKGGDWFGDRLVWAGDYADPEQGNEDNLYSLCARVKKRHTKVKYFRYILNMDTRQYVDKRKVPVTNSGVCDNGKKYCYRIHPLPLLTCEGNGRGCGDYRGESPLIGLWSRQRITVSNEIPEGYTELKFDLVE